jgi:hypothetical protein
MNLNRLATALLALAVLAPQAAPQGRQAPSQEELKAQLEKKLSGDWLKNADWHTDLDAAKAAAKESGKLIFAYFSRSYAA